MEYDYSPIFARICQAKSDSGLTTAEISNLSGISIGTLNKIFAGVTTEPKLPALMALSKSLNVSVDYLIYGKSDITPHALRNDEQDCIEKYRYLDDTDKAKAIAYMDGLLAADKYRLSQRGQVG